MNHSFKKQSSSKSTGDSWLVRVESQEVKGPYSTEAINKMILEGIFSGQEEIAKYPEGDWKILNKQTEFYESLIESLENPVERDEKKAQKMEAETVIRPSMTEKYTRELENEEPTEEDEEEFSSEISTHTQINERKKKAIFQHQIQELIQEEKNKKEIEEFKIKQRIQFQIEQGKVAQQRKDLLDRFKKPLIIALLFLAGYLGYEAMVNTTNENRMWALVTPKWNKTNISDEENKKLKKEAISLMKNGIIDDLIKTQNLLIESAEGSKSDLETLGLLCVTYYQMWPYTKQVSNDLKAVSAVFQHIKQLSPLSSYSDTCHSVYLFTKSQINDSRAVIEKTLDTTDRGFILYPFLNYMKGEIFEDVGSLVNAEAYYREAVKLFPLWSTAEWKIGQALYKQNKFDMAIPVFENILSRNRNHKPSIYSLALSYVKNNNLLKAQPLFERGYNLNQLVPKQLLVEALTAYSQILINQRNKKQALEVVRSALQVSPSHRALKDLFITLGGENLSIGEAQISELIIEGDQFFRLGDFLAAQGRYRAAFDSDNKNTLLALKVAKSMKALNQYSESIKWIDKALSIDPNYFPAYALKAEFLMKNYDFVDAEICLNSALKIDPNNYETLKMMTRLQWEKNNLVLAQNYGLKAYKKFDVDVELLTLLATINIELFVRSKNLKQSNEEQKTFLENAQKYSVKAIEIEPAWPESQITYAKYLYIKDDGSLKTENYYKNLIKTFPYTIDYRLALGDFYENQDKINLASEQYKLVSEVEPKSIKALLGLARCSRASFDYQSATKYYLVATAIDSSNVEPMFLLAQLQMEMAMKEVNPKKGQKLLLESYSRLELVKNRNPNFPKVYYFMAKNKFDQGLYDEARKDIQIEKTKNPNIADSYILNAEIDMKQQLYKECATEYSVIMKLRPSADNYLKAAACHRMSGNIDMAEALITESRELDQANNIYFRELAYVYEARGDKKRAIQSFEDYLTLTARNSLDADMIERKIRELKQ